MKKVVMGLSGGMDSTTLLGMLLNEGVEVHACHFQYGSKHNFWEFQAVNNIINYYKTLGILIILHPISLEGIFADFKSNLLQSGGAIPEGHYEAESMKLTVVPGRNMIFASIMAGLAESIEARAIALGVHSGDHHIYPDCRAEFISSLKETIVLSTDRKVDVIAPLIAEDKTSILEIGYALPITVPYHLTRTCYKDQQYSCKKCGACQERLEAYKNIGRDDPITYKTLINE